MTARTVAVVQARMGSTRLPGWREALAVVDLSELGSRLKQARVALGRTQGEVTTGIVSTAYLSRIEAGTRRPTLDVVKGLASRLETTVHELLLGLTPSSWSAKQVELDWAQLSLRTGDAPAALARTGIAVATGAATLGLRIAGRAAAAVRDAVERR